MPLIRFHRRGQPDSSPAGGDAVARFVGGTRSVADLIAPTSVDKEPTFLRLDQT